MFVPMIAGIDPPPLREASLCSKRKRRTPRIETVDVAPGQEERMAVDERLPQIRGGRVVRSRPTAPRVGEGHGGRLEEDDRRPGPALEVLCMAHPDASDRGERRVRGDGLHPELRWDCGRRI